MTSKVLELFGVSATKPRVNWRNIVTAQPCPFTGTKCYKIRKSDPTTAIGSCSVAYGAGPVIICPRRLLDRRQIFLDCIHLLTTHEPGNELHIVSEVSVPGGCVDFFLVSVRAGSVKDFVGIELQTLDTTGTVWPERQRLLRQLNVPRNDSAEESLSSFGMNWKMTAKTILVQMHHKAQTFEHVNKKLVLIVQDRLLHYMTDEFNFGHLNSPASLGDSVHLHAYTMSQRPDTSFALAMASRISTDADGIGRCLGLQAEARIELEQILVALQAKISAATLFAPL